MQKRTLLKLGLASSALLGLAGGAAGLLFRPGLQNGGGLSLAGREVCTAVGQAVLNSSLPAHGLLRQSALQALMGRIDALVSALPPHTQAELSQLLAVLASAPGRQALAGLDQAWPMAPIDAVQQALQAMRLSGFALRSQAYGALHDIVTGAYFADAGTWPMLGYPGPQKI